MKTAQHMKLRREFGNTLGVNMVKLYSDANEKDLNDIFEKTHLWKKMHPIGRPAFIGATTLKERNNAQPQSVQGECTMNKSWRIKELAREAADGMLSYDTEGEFRLNEKEVFKFAELIVRECIDVLEHDTRDIHPRSHDYCVSLIKEHFGVKE
jgi:hypothetical protein